MWVKPVFSGWDRIGILISKFEEKPWDIDIKKITVSHCHHIACTNFQTKICSNCARTLEEGAIVERDKLEAEKKDLEGRANFLLFTQEQLRSQVS